jgi:hypothetical protein
MLVEDKKYLIQHSRSSFTEKTKQCLELYRHRSLRQQTNDDSRSLI